MAVLSHAFGGVTLTDADAKKFEKQIKTATPTKGAKATLLRASQLKRDMVAGSEGLPILTYSPTPKK